MWKHRPGLVLRIPLYLKPNKPAHDCLNCDFQRRLKQIQDLQLARDVLRSLLCFFGAHKQKETVLFAPSTLPQSLDAACWPASQVIKKNLNNKRGWNKLSWCVVEVMVCCKLCCPLSTRGRSLPGWRRCWLSGLLFGFECPTICSACFSRRNSERG